MKAEELAKLHPHLYHVTSPGSAKSILEVGLLTTFDILERWNFPVSDRQKLLTERRPVSVSRYHPERGLVTISDNKPLSEIKLAKALDDGLTTGQWLGMLNRRVFFFTKPKEVDALRGARSNRRQTKDILVIDTLRLALSYGDRMEITPINTGNTHHQPARRGLSTFGTLLTTDYPAWRKQRGNSTLDRIKEVTVVGSVPNLSAFVTDVQVGAEYD